MRPFYGSFSSLSDFFYILEFTLTVRWEKVSKKTLMEDKHSRSESSLWFGWKGYF